MEFRSSIHHSEENSYQMQGSWIPVTPSKPEQINRPARTQWQNSGAYSNRIVQENACQEAAAASNSTTAAGMQFNPTTFADRVQDLNYWKAAIAAQNKVSAHYSYMEAVRNAASSCSKIPYSLLLTSRDGTAATAQGGINAATLRSPVSHIQIDGNCNQQQRSNPAANLLHMNQPLLQASSPSSYNNTSWPLQTSQYGFPVPYHATYNHNSPAKTMADAVTNGIISFQQAPVTADRGRRVQTSQMIETTGLPADERVNHEIENVGSLPRRDSLTAQAMESVKPSSNQGLLQPVNSLSPSVPSTPMKESHNHSNREGLGENSIADILSTPVKENHNPDDGETQAIDLNQTPQQKPKRKRHRPKVIREGKAKRTPKPATPNQAINKENPLGKRKYVRKAGLEASVTPLVGAQETVHSKRKYVRKAGLKASVTPLAEAQETVDSYGRTGVRSSKRALNFDLEGKAEVGQPSTIQVHPNGLNSSTTDNSSFASCTRALNLDAETQYRDSHVGIDHSFGSKETLQVAQGLEGVVGNSQAGIAFDLNHFITRPQGDCISLPGKPNPCQTIASEEPSMEQMKALAMNQNIVSTGPCINVHHSGHAHMHQNAHANERNCRIHLTKVARDNHQNIEPSKLQNGLPPILENQFNLNSRSHLLMGESNHAKMGSKREYNHTVDETHLHPMNLFRTHNISMQACQRTIQQNKYYGKSGAQGIDFPDNYKKLRTAIRHNELTSNAMLPVTIRHDSTRQATSTSVSEVVANQLALQTGDGRSFLLCNLMQGNKKPQNGISNTVHDVHSQSTSEKHDQTVPNISREVFSYFHAQRGINPNEPQAPKSRMGLCNIEKTMKEILERSIQTNELSSLTAATVECDRLPTTPVKTPPTYNDIQVSNIFWTPKACMETLVADNYAKMKTKELVHIAHPMSSSTSPMSSSTSQVYLQEHKAPAFVYHQSQMQSRVTTPVQKPIGPTTSSSKQSQPRTLQTVPFNFIHSCQSSSNNQQMLGASFQSQVIATHTDPVDEIVRRLKGLNINGGSKIVTAQAESALVPYGGDNKMVPYEGTFNPTKKRHPRPKVNLDQETDRVWKLLMWKEGSESTEGMDANKEQWWEEERRVFRGRADSFIARMHLVQGDRRFSPWKGSVVDSVVGVFLTQNVSDHLSSSAYMALAARFPLQSRNTAQNVEGKSTSTEEQDVSILESDYSITRQSKIDSRKENDRGSIRIREIDHLEEKEIASSNESFGISRGVCTADYSKGNHLAACQIGSEKCQESPENRVDKAFSKTGSAHTGFEDRKAVEDVVSSQVSVISSQNSTESTVQATDRIGSSSDSNSEVENLINMFECDDFDSSTSFMDLLQMKGTNMFNKLYVNGNESMPSKENFDGAPNQLKGTEYGTRISYGVECQRGPSNSTTSIHRLQTQQEFKGRISIHSNAYHLHLGPRSSSVELEGVEASEESRSSLPSTASEIADIKDDRCTGKRINNAAQHTVDYAVQRNPFSNDQTTLKGDSCISIVHPSPTSDAKPYTHLDAAKFSSLVNKQTVKVRNIAEPSLKDEVCSSKNGSTLKTKNDLKEKRGMSRADKKREFDWDSLRKQACLNSPKKERSNTMDSLDWEAIRCADVKEISNTIRERGMNNMLSERIKDFLNRLVREHGSIDLEWLRDVPPDKAKDYLLSIRGLGLKSVECVRLLTLHHLAFPVDTNVGRICVRLGWVPLQPLPESLQLHLLELYPLLETIQKYLWPRLCTLDQRTLYELHYQMITFGKVFCTKSKPNCNACPMRGECKHFASAFASARLALPGPEEKRLASWAVPTTTEQDWKQVINLRSLPPTEENQHSQAESRIKECQPIIEEPATPEPICIDTSESAIEDAFWTDDPDEIPTIKLNFEEFTQNVQNYMQENGELQEGDMSKALVALTQEAASIPMPKLKNVSRLRTEHQVYELPDSHPLLAELDRREPDDPCPYLLAIWTPGETAQSIQPPEICCNSQKSGNLCSKKTCFACNSIREENAQTIRGTLLIPCRTAMRGRFPLNGTYFQVNEVFADHDSSLHPIDVPRAWIWNLPRRTVYFGTSIPTIFKGLTTEGIQQCFWRGFVCVRGFDQKTRAPRPLIARLHFPASKLVGTKKTPAGSE